MSLVMGDATSSPAIRPKGPCVAEPSQSFDLSALQRAVNGSSVASWLTFHLAELLSARYVITSDQAHHRRKDSTIRRIAPLPPLTLNLPAVLTLPQTALPSKMI
jgi:hypothetical protein